MSRVKPAAPQAGAPPAARPAAAPRRKLDPLAEPQAAAAWAMPDRPSRGRLAWRRARARLRSVLMLLVLAGVGSVVVLGLQTFGQGANLPERMANLGAGFGLRVTDIQIEGREKTPLSAIADALKVYKGQPILGFSVTAARARLEKVNWVQSASVRRQLPNTIVVQIVERRPFAVWQLDGKFMLIDKAGNTVTDSDVATFSSELLLLVGPGAPAAAASLVEALQTQPTLQSRIAAAVRVGERRWNLQMKNGTDVLLPEGAEVRGLAKLAELQASLSLLDRPLKQIDLRLPDRLTLRTAGDKSETKPLPPSPSATSQPAAAPPATSPPAISPPAISPIGRKT